ncbi:hypothetical protein [Tenacibaculum finnmarkense]|uniref:hypothetical protein n=1 Tax=Tenacibaculum finnmarkense TaxID=2781243 RepID=UPI001EFB9F5C|nr:hypothetical protein [Tenacibaculum finnmarkense]MCG8250925.1 hypothetical protein [Tenacibaculum finnmarkense genomovar finnmarkense]MCG8814813.1 hypothetical protein [Tenacibaculum finnmarkense]MCG8819745.1 hypothetical protein [Tenacibaculum finnmarkense]
MKKIIPLFVILVLIFSNCTSDEDNSDNSSIQINPPNWIQGKWLLEGSLAGESGWKFTNNDFIIIQANTEISQRKQLQLFSNNGQDVSASDTSSDDSYSIRINTIGGQSVTYGFTKISENEISWDASKTIIYIKN